MHMRRASRSNLPLLGERLVIGPVHNAGRERVARDILHLPSDCKRASRGRQQLMCLRRLLRGHELLLEEELLRLQGDLSLGLCRDRHVAAASVGGVREG